MKPQSAAEGSAMRKRKLRPIAGSSRVSPPSIYQLAVAMMEKQERDSEPEKCVEKGWAREQRKQKEIEEAVKETRAIHEKIKKKDKTDNGRRKFLLDFDDEVVDESGICISSTGNPELMAKIMLENVPPLRKPIELDTNDPNLIRIANIAIHNFNNEYESSYVLERVITGSRIFRGGYDYTMAFVAAHPYKSIKVTSLFYAHYMDSKEDPFFWALKLMKPFIELPERGGNDLVDDGDDDDDDVRDAARDADEEDAAAADPNDGKDAAEAQSNAIGKEAAEAQSNHGHKEAVEAQFTQVLP